MSTITLTVPMPVNIANGRMHHMVKHRTKVAYWRELDLLAQLDRSRILDRTNTPCRVPEPPASPLSPVRIDSVLYLGATMDDDNALARLKWVADWLKTRKYIRDDKRPHCRFTVPEQIVKRDGNYRVELTITPL